MSKKSDFLERIVEVCIGAGLVFLIIVFIIGGVQYILEEVVDKKDQTFLETRCLGTSKTIDADASAKFYVVELEGHEYIVGKGKGSSAFAMTHKAGCKGCERTHKKE